MKPNLFLLFFLSILFSCSNSEKNNGIPMENYALQFDGIDDKVDLYLSPLNDDWTISAWVYIEDDVFEPVEAIISCGWATIHPWEGEPLQLIDGYPSVGTAIKSNEILAVGWHHLAVINSTSGQQLFVNGILKGSSAGSKGICPSFIGASDAKHFFNGLIDEVRIWNMALDVNTLKEWAHKPLTKDHPEFKILKAAFNFDNQHLDATDLTGQFHGDIKKHYTSDKSDNTPSYVVNTNHSFKGQYSTSDYQKTPIENNVYEGLDSIQGADKLKVLAWNIWHGGIENGVELGRKRVVDIIKASQADVVLMIETYGSGPYIAEQLGFHYYTLNVKDNLAIFSRFPITEFYPSKHNGFFSLGAKVTLPNNASVVVWDVWLRYALPDYALEINDPEYTIDQMIEGDLNYAVKDINAILEKDISHYVPDTNSPLILGGDFNSCSHLDWTEETAKAGLHYGKAVDFPTSKVMYENGFSDSFREIHPDPSTHIGETWSPLYNYCEDFRIDFVYYRGKGIELLDSRTIDHHPDPSQMFPSDHAGVLSIFKVENQ